MTNPYLKNLRTVVFDIETMGLSPAKNMIINAGFCDPNTLKCTQLFAEGIEDEGRLLKDIISILSEYDAVITYNGDNFDIPFLKTRCQKWNIDYSLHFWSIDMYRYLKKYWLLADKLPRMNQKSVEVALGLSDDRTDLIGGELCIPYYEEYLKSSDPEKKRLILLHNADDICQLAKIYNKSVFLPYDQIAFERGFGIKSDEFIICKSIRMDNKRLYAEAIKQPGGIPSSIYDDAYELEYDNVSGCISLAVNISLRDNGTKYVDLKKLPCHEDEFSILSGYHSGYLVLSDGKIINYKEINNLIIGIFTTAKFF